MKLTGILISKAKEKRYTAYFRDDKKSKKVHFGSKNGSTYIDHKDDKKKRNYIARHSKLNEDWTNPYTAGTLSRFILWNKPTFQESVKDYKKRFNV